MGVRNYLIDGVSGSGKTTLAEELDRRGHHVVHGDRVLGYLGDPETGEALNLPPRDGVTDRAAWQHKHWIWNIDTVKSLAADRRHANTFFCGGARNSHRFLALFDTVFVLDIDLDTLNRRLAARPQDEFGGKPDERALIVRLHATREDDPKGGIAIDATAPIERVADEILRRCREIEAARPPNSD